jgi:predicted DNA-binding helix-hairpin-helix protein
MSRVIAIDWDGHMMVERREIRYVLPQPVDLNTASFELLMLVRGIGQNYAKRIIEGRPYQSVAALVAKRRLPKYVLERIRRQITIGQPSRKDNRGRFHEEPLMADRDLL